MVDDAVTGGMSSSGESSPREPIRTVQDSIWSYYESRPSTEVGGDRIVGAVDEFLFKFIETVDEAQEIFAFIANKAIRKHVARAFLGARWVQKVGLVFARPAQHDVHHAQVRLQIVEYGRIAEISLRQVYIQKVSNQVPDTFNKLIDSVKQHGILTKEQQDLAHSLRTARNRVHLNRDVEGRKLVAASDAISAYSGMVSIIQACRRSENLGDYPFGKAWREVEQLESNVS